MEIVSRASEFVLKLFNKAEGFLREPKLTVLTILVPAMAASEPWCGVPKKMIPYTDSKIFPYSARLLWALGNA